MNSKEWINNNLNVVPFRINEWDEPVDAISWISPQGYQIYTFVDAFVEMFGLAIEDAIENGNDVRQAIKDSDPDNMKGFNEIL